MLTETEREAETCWNRFRAGLFALILVRESKKAQRLPPELLSRKFTRLQ